MTTNAITNINTTAASSTSNSPSNSLGSQDFLQILTTQLRNQDPLSPMSNTEFIAQMAQLSTLQSTQDMSKQLTNLLETQQRNQALQMVGRDVDYTPEGSDVSQTGRVSAVLLNASSPVLLIEGKQVSYTQIQSIR